MRKFLLLILLGLAAAPALAQQHFSCSIGRAACLGFGDKVVDQNAVCFSGSTCGYGGFVCKSKLDDAISEYNRVVNSYNELLRKNRALADIAQDGARKSGTIAGDYNELLARHNRLAADYESKVEELRVLTANYNELLAAQRPAARGRDGGEKKK